MSIEDHKKQLLEELNSPQARLCCEDHQFYPGSKLTMPMVLGCKYCIMAELFYQQAITPPHLRKQRMEELQQLVHHMVEKAERGEWDIELFAQPQMTIEKGEE